MNDEKERLIKEIERRMEGLPDDIQEAVWWCIANINLVREICKNSSIPKEEMAEHKQRAIQRGDSLLLVLLYLCEILGEQTDSRTDNPIGGMRG